MRFPLYIAKRYLISKSGTNAVNIITWVSTVSIILGTMVLFIVLSAFSGLKEFNLSITSIVDPDLKVVPAVGKTLTISREQEKKIAALEDLRIYSKIIEERAYLEYQGKSSLAYLKGVDQNYLQVTRVDSTIYAGSWPSIGEPQIAAGIGVRRALSLNMGDFGTPLNIMVPKPGTGQITDPSQAFSRSGAIASGFFQAGEALDNDHVFANIDFVGELLQYPIDTVSAIEIALSEGGDESRLRENLKTILQQEVLIKNRIELNDTLHKMLNTENLALYFICTLVLIIALFSFIGSIIMVIIDKRKHIKTLSDLGATLSSIRMTFFYQGALIILIGGGAGVLLGIVIIGLQQYFGLVMITPSLAYPVLFEFQNVLLVYATILILGFLAARLAATRINEKLIASS